MSEAGNNGARIAKLLQDKADKEFAERICRLRKQRMDAIDSLSSEVRALVHEYGYTVVRAYLDLGIQKPSHIRHLVETVLNEFSPTRGSYSSQGVRAAKGFAEETE